MTLLLDTHTPLVLVGRPLLFRQIMVPLIFRPNLLHPARVGFDPTGFRGHHNRVNRLTQAT